MVGHHDDLRKQEEDAANLSMLEVVVVGCVVMLKERLVVFEAKEYAGQLPAMEVQLHSQC